MSAIEKTAAHNVSPTKKYGVTYDDDSIFRLALGTPDNENPGERIKSSVILGGAVGAASGWAHAIVTQGVSLANMRLDNKRVLLASVARYGSIGVLAGALYAFTVNVSSKLRGETDGPLNHFLGGFGVSSALAVHRGQMKTFGAGFYIGTLLALFKQMYMKEMNAHKVVVNKGHCVMPCRYPEFYMAFANTKDLPALQK